MLALAGLLLTVLLIERIGRKKTMAIEFFLGVVFFFLMYICPIHKYVADGAFHLALLHFQFDRIVLMTFIFGARSALTGAFQAAYVYTPEVSQ